MNQADKIDQYQKAAALLRVTLAVIILVTWYDNLTKGLYSAEGLTGFFNWLFDAQNGNGSSLGFYKSILDTMIVPLAGPFAVFQMIAELLMGLALLFGGLTRFFGLAAMFFFLNLLLAYFGGHEWIWVYVLLVMSALTVAISQAGRRWGIDKWLVDTRGEPPLPILW